MFYLVLFTSGVYITQGVARMKIRERKSRKFIIIGVKRIQRLFQDYNHNKNPPSPASPRVFLGGKGGGGVGVWNRCSIYIIYSCFTYTHIMYMPLNTLCPRSSDPILCSKLLNKMGHYSVDTQYVDNSIYKVSHKLLNIFFNISCNSICK